MTKGMQKVWPKRRCASIAWKHNRVYLSSHCNRQRWWNTCPQRVKKMSSDGINKSWQMTQRIFILRATKVKAKRTNTIATYSIRPRSAFSVWLSSLLKPEIAEPISESEARWVAKQAERPESRTTDGPSLLSRRDCYDHKDQNLNPLEIN